MYVHLLTNLWKFQNKGPENGVAETERQKE